jgi:hypothetical protein
LGTCQSDQIGGEMMDGRCYLDADMPAAFDQLPCQTPAQNWVGGGGEIDRGCARRIAADIREALRRVWRRPDSGTPAALRVFCPASRCCIPLRPPASSSAPVDNPSFHLYIESTEITFVELLKLCRSRYLYLALSKSIPARALSNRISRRPSL